MYRSFVLLAGAGSLVFACGGSSAPPAGAPEAGSEAVPAQAAPIEETQSAPPAAAVPAPSPPPVPTAALQSEDELTRAERELAAADRELSGNTEIGAAETERHDGAPGRGSGPGKPKSTASQQQPCATTCKAFASLVRARDSICRIDGSDGERCDRANQIVERHTARSTSCRCNG